MTTYLKVVGDIMPDALDELGIHNIDRTVLMVVVTGVVVMPLTVLKSISWLGSVSGASIMIMLAFCVVVIARSSSTCDGGVTCGSGSVKAVDITMVLLDRQHHRIDALAYRIHSWRFRQCASRMSVTHVCCPYFRSFTRQMRRGAGQSQSQLTTSQQSFRLHGCCFHNCHVRL